MPKEAERFVLDTSALLTLKLDEPGAAEVQRILETSKSHGGAFASFISLMEYYYVLMRGEGEAAANQGYAALKHLPMRIIESDAELGLAAGRIKASHRLSLADAWVAATAERLKAILVHKDPEFNSLKGEVRLHALPFKS